MEMVITLAPAKYAFWWTKLELLSVCPPKNVC